MTDRLRTVVRAATIVLSVVVVVLIGGVALSIKLTAGHAAAPSVLAQALTFGCLDALFAVGIVVIYRASRVINFAHGGMWVVSFTVFWEIVGFHGITYWLALPAAVLAGGLVAGATELIFVRRFFTSARLIVAVVTLGLAELLLAVAHAMPDWFGDHDKNPGLPTTPLSHFAIKTYTIRFSGDYVAVIVLTAVALGALGLFFRFTSAGIAVRGAAQNADRASELGVNVKNLSTLMWTIAGLLAGLAAALQIPITGWNQSATLSSVGVTVMLPALAAAVIGGMDSIPITVAASLTIAVLRQVTFFAFHQSAIVDVVLLVVIIGAFVIQRRSLGRTDESGGSTWAATEEVRPIPAALGRLVVVRSSIRNLTIVLVAVVLGYPFVMSPSQTNLGSLVFIDGIVVISLVILTGWGGQVSLGQYAFVAVGGFVGGILSAKVGLPFPLALIGASCTGAAVAVVLGVTALRIRGLYLAVTTLAFSIVVSSVVLSRTYLGKYIPQRIGRPELFFIKTEDNRAYYYVCLAALVLAWWMAVGLRRSRTGRVLIAMRDNERSAQAFGVNLIRTRLVTFALSGFMAAAAGMLLAAHDRTVSPGAFSPDRSIQIFLTAIIGGLGSIQGALLGAVYFAVVDFFVHGAIGQLLASAIGVLVVLYVVPGGLGSLAYKGRDAVLRRIAIRRRIWVPSLFSDAATAAGLSNKAPLAPLPEVGGAPKEVPVKYRQPSRIRVAGSSQAGPRWDYS